MLKNINELAQVLRAARKTKKLSQGELAKKVGLPQSHLSKIETGRVNLKLASFIELARALGLEVILIPTSQVNMVKSLLTLGNKSQHLEMKPAYSLDEEDENV